MIGYRTDVILMDEMHASRIRETIDTIRKIILDKLQVLSFNFGLFYEYTYDYCHNKLSIKYGKDKIMPYIMDIHINEIINVNDVINAMIKNICQDCDIKMEDKMGNLWTATNYMNHFDWFKTDYVLESKKPQRLVPEIEKVIFNKPATIVLWKDDTKTVVKAHNEEFDPEKGLAMAISKKALGNQGNYCNEINKWCDEYEKKVENVVEIKLNTEGMSKGLNEALESLHQAFVKGLK